MPLSKARARERSRQSRADLKTTAQKIIALSLPARSGVMSVEERRQTLSQLAQLPPEHPDPVKAIDTLNKMDNLYVQKTANLNLNLNLQSELDKSFASVPISQLEDLLLSMRENRESQETQESST